VARRFHATIISVDSMQVYREMDIGTAKPGADVRAWVDYRMVDVCEPRDDYTVHEFQRAARRHIEELALQHRRVVIAGGSGLHFRAVVDPMTFAPSDAALRAALEEQTHEALVAELLAVDANAAKVVDLANSRRVIRAVEIIHLVGQTPTMRANTAEAAMVRSYEPLLPFNAFGIDPFDGSATLVADRLDAMLAAGFVDEVERLVPVLGTSASQAIGYRDFARMLTGEITRDEAIADTIRATNGLVKRQRTFFRRDPRIAWLPWHGDRSERIERAVMEIGEKMQWSS
jgi:tRNA dimethylallyltransferase